MNSKRLASEPGLLVGIVCFAALVPTGELDYGLRGGPAFLPNWWARTMKPNYIILGDRNVHLRKAGLDLGEQLVLRLLPSTTIPSIYTFILLP